MLEGIRFIREEHQPDDRGEADAGALAGLHERPARGEGVRGRDQGPQQVQPQRAAHRQPRRAQAGGEQKAFFSSHCSD